MHGLIDAVDVAAQFGKRGRAIGHWAVFVVSYARLSRVTPGRRTCVDTSGVDKNKPTARCQWPIVWLARPLSPVRPRAPVGSL